MSRSSTFSPQAFAWNLMNSLSLLIVALCLFLVGNPAQAQTSVALPGVTLSGRTSGSGSEIGTAQHSTGSPNGTGGSNANADGTYTSRVNVRLSGGPGCVIDCTTNSIRVMSRRDQFASGYAWANDTGGPSGSATASSGTNAVNAADGEIRGSTTNLPAILPASASTQPARTASSGNPGGNAQALRSSPGRASR